MNALNSIGDHNSAGSIRSDETQGEQSEPSGWIQFKPMSDKTFLKFSQYVHAELGIKMPKVKKAMLQARLQKRLRKLEMTSFDEYYDYVFSPRGTESELPHMIDVITTNKTDFFREPKHFDYLAQAVLPRMLKWKAIKIKKQEAVQPSFPSTSLPHISLWSAGCSSGEEPYTLAMIISDYAEKNPGFTHSILATDISLRMLEKARLGIYDHERVEPVPMALRKKYLLKSKDENKSLIRIVPQLRSLIRFQRLNLMDETLSIRETLDIIFFRNVLIYFDRTTQQKVLNSICRYLHPNGYMFLGHSETLNGLNVPLSPVATAVYRKTG